MVLIRQLSSALLLVLSRRGNIELGLVGVSCSKTSFFIGVLYIAGYSRAGPFFVLSYFGRPHGFVVRFERF